MTSDPKGWPDEAREAVARRCYGAAQDALRHLGALAPIRDVPWRDAEQWVRDCQMAEAAAAFTALAPFLAARIAAAREEGRIAGLREAVERAAKIAPIECEISRGEIVAAILAHAKNKP